MQHFSLISLLFVSFPEEFCLSLMAWTLLGKRDTVKFYNVFISAAILAVSFQIIYELFNPNPIVIVLQFFSLMIVLYFVYRLTFIEAVLGTFISGILITVIQASVIEGGYVLTGLSASDIPTGSYQLSIYAFVECLFIGLISILLHSKNIKLITFKKKKTNAVETKKIRYLVLQLTFVFLIVFINYRLFFFNFNFFKTFNDKVLILLNFMVIITFTILAIKSAFKMSESVQKEEEQKRQIDNKEIVQNIDYLCRLMDTKEYSEVNTILKSIKQDVDNGLQKIS